MADSDKNILIRPNRGATSQPVITFTGQGNDPITLRVLDGATGTGITAGGALSFEGSAGQLFSIVNRLGTGSIFSVNDISGIPSIDVDANGTISLAGFTGNVAIGLTGPTERLHVIGNIRLSGGLSAASATFSNDIIVNGVRVGEGGGSISTNVAVGQNALNANTTGSHSVAIGTDAATTGVTVTNITAVGYRSLYLNRADNNTSVGNSSLLANTTGTQNVSIGTSALFSNTTGSFNVGMGHGALNSQIDSTENIAVGRLTLQNLSSGSQNTAIGSQAGRYFGSGTTSATNISNSILIGYDARPSGNTESNQIVIGYQGRGDGSNTTVIGNSSTTSTRVFGQLSTNGGISAAGGITFNAPISSTRLPRFTSAAFETKVADFTPSNADNGKIFLVNHTSKTAVTVTLDNLNIGWRAKFIAINSGVISFSSSFGSVYGAYGADGSNTQPSLLDPIVEVICYDTNLYFAG